LKTEREKGRKKPHQPAKPPTANEKKEEKPPNRMETKNPR